MPRLISAAAFIAAAIAFTTPLLAQTAPLNSRITVHTDRPGPAISPMLHGIFFEDINYGADGGLYAELIQNRSFEHDDALFAWSESKMGRTGDITISDKDPMNPSNPHFLRITLPANAPAGKPLGTAITNSGFGGIAVKQNEPYRFSVRARANPLQTASATAATLDVILQDEEGKRIATAQLTAITPNWTELKTQFTANKTTAKATLTIVASGAPGTIDLDVVSLFPEHTFKNRPNGLRADLAQTLADMKPAFMRFPGGCIVEGDCQENMYRWKETIGDIAERRQTHNRWMKAVAIKAPQYYQTFGLGFFEYFQLCEDIGAQPLPILNCGMSCQFQLTNFYLSPLEDLTPYIQDALDLIEFANGPVTTTWGAKRAAMGHPAPFNMKYLGIGNEQWGEEYFPRYKKFYDAIKPKYPGITLVTTAGPAVDDQWWNLAWNKFKTKTAPADLVDEHYYRPPRWFYDQASRYDAYDRNGPKVFAGEFAAHGLGKRNNLTAALAEAAFMTGLVRNADIVELSAYAPLLAKISDTQWTPDLIWFDNTSVYKSPSYHVQSLFSQNKGDTVLPTDVAATTSPVQFAAKAVTLVTETAFVEYKNLKITSGDKTIFTGDFSKGLGDWRIDRGDWKPTPDGGIAQIAPQGGRLISRIALPPDAVLSFQARKTGGTGGFGITATADQDSVTWMLGARVNTRHQLEISGNAHGTDATVDTDRWYDVRLELTPRTAKAYLDNTLLQSEPFPTQKGLFAVATQDTPAHEIILKVINPTDQPATAALAFTGPAKIQPNGKSILLTSASPDDENSFTQPEKVSPKESPLPNLSNNFTHTFPPFSLTILRLPTTPK